MNWTASQRRAIDETGASVLVSAGAGSGKTAVLAERCAHVAADARPPCPVDRLLVVTFTDAAAAEMRERIGQALRARLAASPTSAWLQRQIAMLDAAAVSTLHAFCKRTLERHFAAAGLDPGTPLMDEHDATLLRRETARNLFEQHGDRDDARGEAFHSLIAAYGGGRDDPVVECVLSLDAFLASLPDPDRWLDEALARFAADAGGGLPAFWLDQLRRRLADELAEQEAIVGRRAEELRTGPAIVRRFADCLTSYATSLSAWRQRLGDAPDAATVDGVGRGGIGAYEFPDIPRRTRAINALKPAAQSTFKDAADSCRRIRDKLFTRRLLEPFGRFTTAEWADGLARTRPHAEALVDLVRAFRAAYRDAKADLGVMDFSDLERLTYDVLRDDANGVARRLRDRFEHVLVDEYQDINPLQAEILRCVSREADAGRDANLFTVGDVKQSIYRFRLAEPRQFVERRDDFAARPPSSTTDRCGVVIDLVENFRSRRGVLDAVNCVFERLMSPELGGVAYDEHARLKAGRADADGGPMPACTLHVLSDVQAGPSPEDPDDETAASPAFDWERIEREAYVIGGEIRRLVSGGAAHGDIVILLRSLRHRGPLFVRTLSRMGIPVFADVAGGFFDSLEVADVLSLLMLLDNEQQDIPMAAVLRSPILGEPLTDSQLVELRTAPDLDSPDASFQAAARAYAEQGRDPALRARLRTVFDRLHRWRQRVRRRPLADVIWEIYRETSYLAYVQGLREGPQRRANLVNLHERARQFATFGRHGLYRFLRFIEDLQEADEDLAPGTVRAEAGDVVRVMTIHRSKGLEFPIVFVAELGKRFNLSDASGSILFDRRLGLGLAAVDVEKQIVYPTLPHRLAAQSARAESLSEELRILYVAMTRARERLVLVGTAPLAAIEDARAAYAGHSGVLPLLERHAAASALDWVLPAICCQDSAAAAFVNADVRVRAPKLFEVRTHAADEMAGWVIDPPQKQAAAKKLEQFRRLAACRVKPSGDDAPVAVERIRRRLTTPYPADAMTRVPAVLAASELKHRWQRNAGDDEELAAAWPSETRQGSYTVHRFTTPEFIRGAETAAAEGDLAADAAQRGTWTHAFLERVDLRSPCDLKDLKRQLAEYVSTGVLPAEASKGIDLNGVAWFMHCPLGLRLRGESTRVLREQPFVIAVPPARYDPSIVGSDPGDAVLVRGIIDCLFDAGDGWEILDYKTDDVTGEALTARADEYRGQLAIYADAVEATWARPVRRRWLAFLAARRVVEV